MNVEIVAFMLGISLILGFFGLLGFLWGLKNEQFDDENKMMEGVLFDTPEDLNKVANQHQKHDFLQELDSQITQSQNKKES